MISSSLHLYLFLSLFLSLSLSLSPFFIDEEKERGEEEEKEEEEEEEEKEKKEGEEKVEEKEQKTTVSLALPQGHGYVLCTTVVHRAGQNISNLRAVLCVSFQREEEERADGFTYHLDSEMEAEGWTLGRILDGSSCSQSLIA